jgi:hypothetical protein
MNDTKPLLGLREMAMRLRVPAKWLRTEAAAGHIPCVRAGAAMIFDPETVEAIIRDRAKGPSGKEDTRNG